MAQYTVLFQATPWKGEEVTAFTEYVNCNKPDPTDKDLLTLAIHLAAARWGKEHNKDIKMVKSRLTAGAKVLAISDGFVPMGHAPKAKRRTTAAQRLRANYDS